MRPTPIVPVLALLICAPAFAQRNPFAENVRSTDPLTPEEERATFRVPEGFEVELVAAEPDIQKPMNLAFDTRGRLWVSGSVEYPYAAPADRPGRDEIKILEDTDGDGRADVIKTFADGLNIPIGLLPVRGGVIAWSIPHIWLLEDTDGDDRADRRTRLLGPFGFERDTHGMNNAFRRGFDGWTYACHGFNNITSVQGADGHVVAMQSGNTYRFRRDGSRIEQFTWGQVNPFGMALDSRGNLFTADCHSSPIYQLLRGGYYPSFGKPHDGLGFVPPMMQHGHGSTAICGLAYYAGGSYPEEFRDSLYVGNVMTCRVHRDAVEYHGSTMRAREMPDFLSTSDPWFRPVDVRMGPDGAIYVADFYNRVIGHYEVPLDHPGRDRHRGRIWRIVWKGEEGAAERPRSPDMTRLDVAGLVEELGHANLARRMLALSEVVDRIGMAGVDELRDAAVDGGNDRRRVQAMWALWQLGSLEPDLVRRATTDGSALVRTHALRMLAERAEWTKADHDAVLARVDDEDAFARRAACDALGRHPAAGQVSALLRVVHETDEQDDHLIHVARMALREHVRTAVPSRDGLSKLDARTLAGVALGADTEAAALFLVAHLRAGAADEGERRIAEYLRHATRHAPASAVDDLARVVRERFRGRLELQLELIQSVRRGLEQRGADAGPEARAWAGDLARALLEVARSERVQWTVEPVPGKRLERDPWVIQARRSADGDESSRFFCSLPRGENLTAVLRSVPFEAPETLSFWLAGHIGYPDRPIVDANWVRLRDAASGEVLAECRPPRNDTAQRVEWSLGGLAGRRVVLEVIDGDDANAYAWLAIGRFQPPVVSVPSRTAGDLEWYVDSAAEIAGAFGVDGLDEAFAEVLKAQAASASVQRATARALLAASEADHLRALSALLASPELPSDTRGRLTRAIVSKDDAVGAELVVELAAVLPAGLQGRLAAVLVETQKGTSTLLALVESGKVSARVLQVSEIEQKVLASGGDAARERLEELTEGLPSPRDGIDGLIAERVARLDAGGGDASRGAKLFEETCATCHQLGGKGQVVGPQLDGIGKRGVARLVEDLLDPNRNVDVAFRTATWILDDGSVVSGLHRRDEGATTIVADSTGKEISVPASRVVRRVPSSLSLMPENITLDLPPERFDDLVRYLLEASASSP